MPKGILRKVSSGLVIEVIKMCCWTQFQVDSGANVTVAPQNSSEWINMCRIDAHIQLFTKNKGKVVVVWQKCSYNSWDACKLQLLYCLLYHLLPVFCPFLTYTNQKQLHSNHAMIYVRWTLLIKSWLFVRQQLNKQFHLFNLTFTNLNQALRRHNHAFQRLQTHVT